MASDPRDDNRIPVIAGVSSVDNVTPTPIAVNPATNAIIVQLI